VAERTRRAAMAMANIDLDEERTADETRREDRLALTT